MEPTETVYVIDDDEAVRLSIQFLLETEGFRVASYEGAESFLSKSPPPAGCIITDFRMPGLDGLELQTLLREREIHLPLIMMTGFGDVPVAVRALKGGAIDFLEKPFADDALLTAVRKALETDRRMRQAETAKAIATRRIALLTPREREVLALLAQGHGNKDMARILGTSPRTIDVHRARVFQKLDVDSLPDLVRLVIAAGAGASAGA
jgi:two-component system response regulator FixJ